MKKISVLVLAMLLIFQMTAFATSAAPAITIDAPQSGDELSVTVTVTGAAEAPERMTLQVFTTIDANVIVDTIPVLIPANTLVYMGETSTKEEVENGFKYTFATFTLRPVLPTGDYTFKAGGEGIGYTQATKPYTSMTDLIAALRTIDGVTVDADMTTQLIDNGYDVKTGLSTTEYANFNTYWKNKVNAAIINDADFDTTGLADDAYAEFSQEREDLEDAFNKAVEFAILCGAGTNAEFASVIANNTDDNAENDYSSVQDYSYLDELEDLDFVAARMREANYNAINLYDATIANIDPIFDGAVLTAVMNQLDWGVVREAVEYYETKGLFTLDKTKFNAVKNKDNVYKALKDEGITNYTLIPSKFAEISERIYREENSTTNNNQGGSIFGGGIGGGGGVIGGSKDEPSVTDKEENTGNQGTTAPVFTDINTVSWAKTAILDLANKGIINGVGDNKFAPGAYIKREEAVKMLVEAFDLEGNADVQFGDVSKDNWYYNVVLSAVGSGIVNGISENEFGAGKYITRQDLATMAYRALVSKYNVHANESAKFTDFDDLSDYAEIPVSTLKDLGVLSGYDDGSFMPESFMNRAEFACMLYKILNLVK